MAASTPDRLVNCPDADDLLPGEHIASTDPDDAAHWVAVYSELLDVLRGHPDRTAFQATIVRYQDRLAFWRRRLRRVEEGSHDLAGASAAAS